MPSYRSPLRSLQWRAPLTHELDTTYSQKLYGKAHSLPRDIRVLWPSLLSPSARQELRGTVRCNRTATSATNYAFIHEPSANYLNGNALWLRRPGVGDRGRAVATSYSWVEATHCFYFNAGEQTTDATPMWFFPAGGSGISINVGKTLVLKASVLGEHALRLVHYALSGAVSASRPLLRTLRGQPVRLLAGQRAVDKVLKPLLPKLSPPFNPPYDSVQFQHVHMPDSFHNERFIQIVVLGWGREMSFLPSYLNRTEWMRCGRHPHLRPCTLADAAVRVHGPSCMRPVPASIREASYGCRANGGQNGSTWRRPLYWSDRLKVDLGEREAERLRRMLGWSAPDSVQTK